MIGQVGQIFTMDEAAAKLRMSRRAFQDLVKRHPFYASNGNRKLFSEADLASLWEAMRAAPSVSIASNPKAPAYVPPSEEALYARLKKQADQRRSTKSKR